jgi:mannose-6-phosphate isomerase-like protein (cupin superfamily)
MGLARKPRIVLPGEGPTFEVLGQRIIYKATAEHTSGAYALGEGIAPPGSGPPMHVHHREDEGFYVLEGTLEIACGDERFVASAGTFALLPRGVPHAFRNATSDTARVLCIQSPAGVEGFFEHLSVLAKDGRPDPAKVDALMQKYEIEFLFGRA